MRRLAWFTSVVLATLAMIFLLWQFRSAVWLFLFSLAAAATFRLPIKFLTNKGWPFRLALLLVYGLSMVLVSGLLILISLSLLTELQSLGNDFAINYERMTVVWPEEGDSLQQAIAGRLPSSDALYEALVGGEDDFSLIPSMLEITSTAVENIAYLVIIIVLSIYWTADQARFERLWLSLVPVEYRASARQIWRQIETNVGNYIRSELLQSLLAGVSLGLGYWLIGLKYPTLLALIGAAVWLIPILGLILALIPVVIIGLTSNLLVGIVGGVYTLVVFLALEWFVEPRIFDRRRFSGLLLVLVMIAFIDGIGLVGLFLAPPIAVSIQIFFNWFLQKRAPMRSGKTIPELVNLKERVEAIKAKLKTQEEPPPLRVTSLLERLDHLIEEASDVRASAQASTPEASEETTTFSRNVAEYSL